MSIAILHLRWMPLVAGVGLTLGLAACEGIPTDPDPPGGRPADLAPVQQGNPTAEPPPTVGANAILVDASHDGGVWWFPQAGPFLVDEPHQGRALADYLRERGYEVTELGRGERVTEELLASYRFVIRAGEWGRYRTEELEAYDRFLEREVTLVLLSDHRGTDPRDELAERLGITFSGVVPGRVTRLAEHPITAGMSDLDWGVGAAVSAYDPDRVEILGWVGDSVPVMGVVKSPTAKIFFFGDTNAPEWVPQPFIDNLLDWGF